MKSFAPLDTSFCFANAANSSFAWSGSTSMAYSMFPVPSTQTGRPPVTSCASESLSECAGSVETSNVGWPAFANRTARDDEHEVLPTPPLPPTKKYLRSDPAAIRSKPAVSTSPDARGRTTPRVRVG